MLINATISDVPAIPLFFLYIWYAVKKGVANHYETISVENTFLKEMGRILKKI